MQPDQIFTAPLDTALLGDGVHTTSAGAEVLAEEVGRVLGGVE